MNLDPLVEAKTRMKERQAGRVARDSAKYVRVVGEVAFVELTQGKTAIIDAEFTDTVGAYLWCACAVEDRWYAKNYHLGYLHRFILGVDESRLVDHADGDGLNNMRSNLRSCSAAESRRKSRLASGPSRYRGVTKRRNKWRAKLKMGNLNLHLGDHATEESAALAYDTAALEHFGEFARPNFPGEGDAA